MKVAGVKLGVARGNPGPYEMLEKFTLRVESPMCLCTPPPQDCNTVQSVLMFGGVP